MRKAISIIAALVVTFVLAQLCIEHAIMKPQLVQCQRVQLVSNGIEGDVNGDGRVDARDISLVRRAFNCSLETPTKTRTNTPTRTSTPLPPTSTPTPPPATPTAVVTSVLPPELPTPPAGVPHAAMISVGIRDGFTSPWPADIYSEIDCQVAKAVSYYLAEQTGYTIWFDCYSIDFQGDGIALGSEPSAGRTGAWLDGFAGAHVQGFACDTNVPQGPCDYGEKPALVPDPDGAGPLRGGQGLNRNALIQDSERQLGDQLLHNRDGSGRGVRVYSVRNGGGYAGGSTYCLTPLGEQIACTDVLARENFGHAVIGDWGGNYYAGLVATQGLPRPLAVDTPLQRNLVDLMDPGCWLLYHDQSGRAGACDGDVRATIFHESFHAMCIDSHFPVYLGSPLVNMAPEQIGGFIRCMAPWIYPVSDEFRQRLREHR